MCKTIALVYMCEHCICVQNVRVYNVAVEFVIVCIHHLMSSTPAPLSIFPTSVNLYTHSNYNAWACLL